MSQTTATAQPISPLAVALRACTNATCGHTAIAYNSCLMGKASNGELATTMAVDFCVLLLSGSP